MGVARLIGAGMVYAVAHGPIEGLALKRQRPGKVGDPFCHRVQPKPTVG